MFNCVFINSVEVKDLGLLIMRLGIGALFMKHGYLKLAAGQQQWLWLGNQMALLGITYAPIFWGFCAAAVEFIGGLSLVTGALTRVSSLLLIIVMVVAIVFHTNNGDNFNIISHPLSLAFFFMGLMVAGAGKYSIDYYIRSVVR